MKQKISSWVLVAIVGLLCMSFVYFSLQTKVTDVSSWAVGGESREDEVSYILETDKKIKQNYTFGILEVKELTFYLEAVPENAVISVSFFQDGEVQSRQEIVLEPNQPFFTVAIPEASTHITASYTVEIKNIASENIAFWALGEGADTVIVSSYAGIDKVYRINYMTWLAVLILLVAFFMVYKITVKATSVYQKGQIHIFDKLKKYRLLYIVEFILFFLVILSLMNNIVHLYYLKNLTIWDSFLFMLLLICFAWYFMNLIKMAEQRLERLFLIVAIPLVLSYIFFLPPNSVPDEYQHLSKTYLTSFFDFSKNNIIGIPDTYVFHTNYNYLIFFNSLFARTDYTSVVTSDVAVGYHFINYLLPSMALMFSRVVNLPFMFGVILARSVNAVLFLGSGYYIIKKVPVAKIVFFVYLLTPMMLQQAASLSIDVLLHITTLSSIVYLLYLKFSNAVIRYRDIFFLCCMFLIIGLAKYAYLPIFGLVFLMPDKIKKMTKKQWLSLIALLFFAILFIAYYVLLVKSPGKGASYLEYEMTAGVNPSQQFQLLIRNPMLFFDVLQKTLAIYGEYYVKTFIGSQLSYLSLHIDWVIINIFAALLLISPFLEQEKYRFKRLEKIWLLIIFIIVFIFIELGIYLTWTSLGSELVVGIQGRYFIPTAVLLLLIFIGDKKVFIKDYKMKYFFIILILHIFVLQTIFDFFLFM